MFDWFFKRKEIDEIKEYTKKSFECVKKDIHSISSWVEHLNYEKENQKREITELKENISTVKDELEELKNIVSMIGQVKNYRKPVQIKQTKDKQTDVYAVQMGVQMGVQTPNLNEFSITERAIVWVLLNTDMKLSYDDLASMLNKEKSTIRGQINTLKKKSESLIEEYIEKNGKKRIFIPEIIKEKMLKKTKVRVKKDKNLS